MWKGRNVLVAGGAGMIGSHISRELVNLGANVTIADNFSSGSRQNVKDLIGKAEINNADLRYEYNCLRETKNKDFVIQLSADMGGIGYISEVGADIMRNNFLMNINMLHSSYKNKVKRYFYSSSACVYPEYLQNSTDVVPLKESDAYPAEPDQFYGWEKLGTEKMCEAYQRDYGMDIRIARFHNIMGECYTAYDKHKGKAPCHMIIKAIKSMRNQSQEFIIWGDGKQTRSFLDINDCVRGVLKLIESNYILPVNIGTDRLVSIQELADIAIELTGKTIKTKYDLTKHQGVRGRNANLDIARNELNWEPVISLEDSMGRVYKWAIEHYDELENI